MIGSPYAIGSLRGTCGQVHNLQGSGILRVRVVKFRRSPRSRLLSQLRRCQDCFDHSAKSISVDNSSSIPQRSSVSDSIPAHQRVLLFLVLRKWLCIVVPLSLSHGTIGTMVGGPLRSTVCALKNRDLFFHASVWKMFMVAMVDCTR